MLAQESIHGQTLVLRYEWNLVCRRESMHLHAQRESYKWEAAAAAAGHISSFILPSCRRYAVTPCVMIFLSLHLSSGVALGTPRRRGLTPTRRKAEGSDGTLTLDLR